MTLLGMPNIGKDRSGNYSVIMMLLRCALSPHFGCKSINPSWPISQVVLRCVAQNWFVAVHANQWVEHLLNMRWRRLCSVVQVALPEMLCHYLRVVWHSSGNCSMVVDPGIPQFFCISINVPYQCHYHGSAKRPQTGIPVTHPRLLEGILVPW